MSSKKSTARTEISKTVNDILDSNPKFASFERAKDAYNAFIDQFPKLRNIVTYDNFHYYWTKKFPHAKLSARRASAGVPMAKRTMPKELQDAMPEDFKQEEEIELMVFKPRKDKIAEDIFEPLPTGKFIDQVFSKQGGFMPGTTVVIFADGGVGKSTIAFDTQYSIQKMNPKLDCMGFSAEMSRIDLKADIKGGKDWMYDVHQILMDDYKPSQYIALLKKVFLKGYDFLSVDSFQAIMEKLQDKCFMNRNQAKNFILDLCKQANEGKTETGKHTAIFLIQQVNKDGNFVGANALKHDTTAMMFAKFDDHGDRYIMFIKNRRNGDVVKKKLYYTLNDKQEIVWDETQWKEDRQREEAARAAKEELQHSKEQFNQLFLKGGKHEPVEQDEDDMLMDGFDDDDFDDEL